MIKGYIGEKMLKRFIRIKSFTKKHKRLPTNREISRMFKISLGESTKDVLDKYKRSLKCCLLCGKKKNDKIR